MIYLDGIILTIVFHFEHSPKSAIPKNFAHSIFMSNDFPSFVMVVRCTSSSLGWTRRHYGHGGVLSRIWWMGGAAWGTWRTWWWFALVRSFVTITPVRSTAVGSFAWLFLSIVSSFSRFTNITFKMIYGKIYDKIYANISLYTWRFICSFSFD